MSPSLSACPRITRNKGIHGYHHLQVTVGHIENVSFQSFSLVSCGVKNIDTYRKILKNSGEYFVQIFRHTKRKFRDIFAPIFGKTCEKLYEKHEIFLRKF